MNNTSDKNDDNTDYLCDEEDEENSIESFENTCKSNSLRSAQESRIKNTSNIPKCDQEKKKNPEKRKPEADSDSNFTGFLKQTSVRYSQFNIASSRVVQQKGQEMDYRDYNYSEYPVCYPSCSWQSCNTNGQDLNARVPYGQGQLESASSSSGEIAQAGSFYSYGKSLPEVGSESNETIVNEPRADTSSACVSSECSNDSCNYCCSMRQPSQPVGSCHYEQRNPGQEHQLNLGQEHQMMPVPMGVDPSTGFPIYCYPAPMNYPGNAMYSMPVMQMDPNQAQRGGDGHNNVEIGSQSSASSSSAENCHPSMASASSNQNPTSFDMEEFMRKYQKSVQQCYATAQQGIQQSFANAQTQQYFNNSPQSTQQYYSNSNEGTNQRFASSNQATQQYCESPIQENQQSSVYQGMQQAFGSPLGAQQYYPSPSLGAQQYFPPSMAMPANNFFGNNTGLMTDLLQTHTVYSSDYKPFANDGNHFNHFPNGIDIGLAPDSRPIYGPVGTAGVAEMSTGGQVYGMGGACEINMNSYPLSQMSYSSPYNYEMPASSPNYIQAPNMVMTSPQFHTGNMGG
ncbi:uncharacterized protein LOC108045176 isoform X2 [Drosophila rhopaloa]|uniref:Uncharacterized protein LOC108045176 isoform X2 n=1 Tax=Drosophila rhopaloa TaxID=1041015 RepID=A0A6P4F3H6_DRORH|nr:uncharacterized protein LOC108045176 isoform X2 [Drosophila rhopaloa]